LLFLPWTWPTIPVRADRIGKRPTSWMLDLSVARGLAALIIRSRPHKAFSNLHTHPSPAANGIAVETALAHR